MIEKKYNRFDSVCESKIESVDHIPMTRESIVVLPHNYEKFLICSSHYIHTYDFATRKFLHKILFDKYQITSIFVSHSCTKIVSSCSDLFIRVWDIETGVLIKTCDVDFNNPFRKIIRKHTDTIRRFASMSADETKIVHFFHDTIIIFDYHTSKMIKKIHTSHIIWTFFLSNNNKIISIGKDYSVKIWNYDGSPSEFIKTNAKNNINDIPILTDIVATEFKIEYSISLPNINKFVLVGEDNSILVWDMNTGMLLTKMIGHSGQIIIIRITPDNKKIISISKDGTIKLWDLYTGQLLGSIDSSRLIYEDGNLIYEDGKSTNDISYFYMVPFKNKLSGKEQY